MSWHDKYRPASFRGARFWVESHDASGGRRAVVHEYPGRDEPTTEDLGRKAEGFPLQAFVVTTTSNADYMAARDALLSALRQKGPGTLVHPYLGSITVQCLSWRLSESKSNGGMAIFDLAFVEAGNSPSPSVVRAPAAGMRALASAAMEGVKATFVARFSLAKKPAFLRDEAKGVLTKITDLYDDIARLSGIATQVSVIAASVPDSVNDIVAGMSPLSMADKIISLPQTVAAAFEEPWKRYQNLDGTYRVVANMRSGPIDKTAVSVLLRATKFEVSLQDPKYATAMRRKQIENHAAIGGLVRQSALIEAARLAPFVEWMTLDEAELAREKIADALDVEMELTNDDDLYRVLSSLRILVCRSVPPDGAQLPYLVDKYIGQTMPALCLSYDLYETLDRADEIASLNGVIHPGFLPGMEKLRVLANV